jgi:hypothetical protein
MLCVELAMLILGLYALIAGKVSITSSLVVEGIPARIVGLLMIAPLPIAFCVGIIVGFFRAMDNRPVDHFGFSGPIFLIELGILVFFLAAAIIVASIYRVPAGSRRRFRDEDDDDRLARDEDYDDEPRRERRDRDMRRRHDDDDLDPDTRIR